MILPAESVLFERVEGSSPREEGRASRAGGLSRLGATIARLRPGERSSRRHWHEEEDEFLLVLAGEAVVVEEDGEHVIGPGDMCCWPAGLANAHHVLNRSDGPLLYLVVASTAAADRVHYPDEGEVLHRRPPRWWVEGPDGAVLREGATGS